MTWHIICQDHEADTYQITPTSTNSVLEVPVNHAAHPNKLGHNVRECLDSYNLTPTNEGFDFLNLALSVYTADIRVLRKTAYDNWTRDFVLHLPVCSPERWMPVTHLIELMLSFLTGDRWKLFIRKSTRECKHISSHAQEESRRVCLFSGGLDSFIGASDLLAEGKSAWLISHYTAGPLSEVQKNVFGILDKTHPEMAKHLRFYVQPPKRATKVTELTTRSRSILFMGLAIATASSLGEGAELVVPENGLISLNVPLTLTRTSSLSTRTTHPYFLHLLQDVIDILGIRTKIMTPYRFLTKGEMLKQAKSPTLVRRYSSMTMSCSHPGVGRHVSGGNPYQHCGYCVPCIIRRSSMRVVGLDDPADYATDILSSPPSPESAKGRDLRAFQMALSRQSGNTYPSLATAVINSGPIPGSENEFKEFVKVYQRGMNEVRAFFNGV